MNVKNWFIESFIIMASYNIKKTAENLLEYKKQTGKEITIEDVKEFTNDSNDIEVMKEAINIANELTNRILV